MGDLGRAALLLSLDEARELRARLKLVGSELSSHREETKNAVEKLLASLGRVVAESREDTSQQIEPISADVSALNERLGIISAAVDKLPSDFDERLSAFLSDVEGALASQAAGFSENAAAVEKAVKDAAVFAADGLGEQIIALREWSEQAVELLLEADSGLAADVGAFRDELEKLAASIPSTVSAAALTDAARAAVAEIAPTLVGAAGAPGLVWRGKWSRLTEYAPNDVVGHLGSSWVAVRVVIGAEPGRSVAWELVAKAGTDGGGRRALGVGGGGVTPPPAPAEDSFPVEAGVNIVAGQVVVIDDRGNAILASASNIDHAGRIVAIARSSALAGSSVRLSRVARQSGSWSFLVGRAVYLGVDGEITQDHSVGLFQQELGVTISASEVLFQPGLCIVRN